jgi:hypothetical protein
MQLNLIPRGNDSVITIGGNTGMIMLLVFMNKRPLPLAMSVLKLILLQMLSYSGMLKIYYQLFVPIQMSTRVFLDKLFIG